jgi:hypothetical protein
LNGIQHEWSGEIEGESENDTKLGNSRLFLSQIIVIRPLFLGSGDGRSIKGIEKIKLSEWRSELRRRGDEVGKKGEIFRSEKPIVFS